MTQDSDVSGGGAKEVPLSRAEIADRSLAIIIYIVIAFLVLLYVYVIMRTYIRPLSLTNRIIDERGTYRQLALTELAYSIAAIHRNSTINEGSAEEFDKLFPGLRASAKMKEYAA